MFPFHHLFVSVQGVFGYHNGRGRNDAAIKRFIEVMDRVPNVPIVLLDRGEHVDDFINALPEVFSSTRIVGSVPDLSHPLIRWRPYGRVVDVMVWFAFRNALPTNWYVLDGYSFEWPKWAPNVTFCDPYKGFDELTEDRFLAMLGVFGLERGDS